MIVETIITTLDADRAVNIAPMGPRVDISGGADKAFDHFELRPFKTSRTFQNLVRHGQGVMHISDDVELFATAALDGDCGAVALQAALHVDGQVIVDTCRWYEFQVQNVEAGSHRAHLTCQTVFQGRNRDFLGFSRARHAVIEACILATRTDFLPSPLIQEQMTQLRRLVEKTGDAVEKKAFEFVRQQIDSRCQERRDVSA